MKRKSKFRDVADNIQREIVGGRWPAGSQLPAMRELADYFASSLPTVQNAIRVLEGEGLITCRSRQGAFVNDLADREETRPAEGNGKGAGLPHIGLIGTASPALPFDPNGWSNHIQTAAEAELMSREQFFLTRLYSVEPEPDRNLDALLNQVDHLAAQLAGAILLQGGSPYFAPPLMERLDRLGLPWVAINHPNEQIIYNFVSADNLAAGRAAGRCFLLNGLEKILFLSTDLKESVSANEKGMGLVEAYMHAERPIGGICYMRCQSHKEEDGRQAMLAYLERHGTPQGVYAIGDLLVLGAMRALREKELEVPGDVSVIGSTGLQAARYSDPALTVTPQPMEAMGRAAAQMLLRMIQTGERRLPGKQLKGGLVLRDSLKMTEAIRHELIKEKILTNPREAAEAAAGEVHKSREKETV